MMQLWLFNTDFDLIFKLSNSTEIDSLIHTVELTQEIFSQTVNTRKICSDLAGKLRPERHYVEKPFKETVSQEF
jgi:hypothetical protein